MQGAVCLYKGRKHIVATTKTNGSSRLNKPLSLHSYSFLLVEGFPKVISSRIAEGTCLRVNPRNSIRRSYAKILFVEVKIVKLNDKIAM